MPSAGQRLTGRTRRALVAVAAVAVAWIATGVAVRASHTDQLLPGTHVAGIDLGGMSRADAAGELGALPPATTTLTHRERSFTVGAGAVGLELDVEATVERAARAGREGMLGQLLGGASVLWSRHDVAPAYKEVDSGLVDDAIAAIARRVDRDPFAGALSIDPETLRVRAEAPRPGLEVARRGAATALLDALRHRVEAVELPVRRRRAPPLREVQAVARSAREYLTRPLRISGPGGRSRLAPRELAPLLAVEPVTEDGGRAGARLGVDADRLRQLVAEIATEREREARDAALAAAAGPLVVDEQLDFAWRQRRADVNVEPARAGRSVRQGTTRKRIARAIRHGDHAVRVPTRRVAPAVTTRAARRADHLIGTFTTHFACCEPRVTNIRLIARAVDGTLVAPGEQFSLNAVAGPRTAAKGYVPAPFIADGKLVDAVGGGVSQFSTTIYNAAYFAGLQIDSHQPHSWYISRYPPGREATLNYPTIELLWTNDTDAPVLVRTSTTDTSVTVSLYGDNGGRRVEAVSGPRQPVQGGDFAITVTRVIRHPDGRTTREPFTTTYDTPTPSG